jgi:hypothetical protein
MATRTKPSPTEILSGEEGSFLMVRASTLAEALEIAHADAAADDYVITEPDMVRLGWHRAVPCRPRGTEHEIDGGFCEGGYRCHYIDCAEGRGAFQSAFIEITYADDIEDDDPVKARYLAECAAMEARALTGEDSP